MTVIKMAVATFLCAVAKLMGAQSQLLIALTVLVIIDYCTGMIAAVYTGSGLSSGVALKGAVKKLCYFVMVCVAYLADYVIAQSSGILGIDYAWTGTFGAIALCYLISCDLISILENLNSVGISVPFLSSALKVYREKIAAVKS